MTLQHLEPYEGTAIAVEIHLFQKFIGSAIYPTVLLHLDIAYPANRFSRYFQNLFLEHRSVANKILKYFISTKQHSMFFDREYQRFEIEVFIDTSFTDDSIDCKSFQSYIITLYGTPIIWKASKQPTVTTSCIETKLFTFIKINKKAIITIRLFVRMRFYLYENIMI